jgi:hypothetical protein
MRSMSAGPNSIPASPAKVRAREAGVRRAADRRGDSRSQFSNDALVRIADGATVVLERVDERPPPRRA